jgi:hypothetical protein
MVSGVTMPFSAAILAWCHQNVVWGANHATISCRFPLSDAAFVLSGGELFMAKGSAGEFVLLAGYR